MNVSSTLHPDDYQDSRLGDRAFFLAGAACVALCLAALACYLFSGGEPHLPTHISVIQLH